MIVSRLDKSHLPHCHSPIFDSANEAVKKTVPNLQ